MDSVGFDFPWFSLICSGIWKHPYSWHGRTRETSAASRTVATQGLRASCSRCTGSWTVRRFGAGRAGHALPWLTRMALNGKHWPTTEAPMDGWAYGVHSFMDVDVLALWMLQTSHPLPLQKHPTNEAKSQLLRCISLTPGTLRARRTPSDGLGASTRRAPRGSSKL